MEYDIVGKRVPRVDSREKATGGAIYIDDMVLPGMLHGKVLRSPYAHARIVSIDVSDAQKARGVKGVVTAAHLPEGKGGLVGPFIKDEPILAKDKVRFVGEPVAAVAATDLAAAEAAANLIRVEYEELPAVFDPVEAMKPGAPLIHEDVKSYFAVYEAIREGNVCSHTTFIEGDVDKAFGEADIIIEETFKTQMTYQAYIEPYGAIAQWDASGRVTVWTNTQGVFVIQDRICESLKICMSKIRVIAPRLGGGFGGKIETNVQPLCVVLSKMTGKAVKIIVSREEDFLQARPRHPTIASWKMGVKKDGRIVASQMSAVFDSGAYADDGPGVTAVGAIMARGPYRIPNIKMEGYCVYTNKVHTGAMRGFGNTQTTFGRESMMDIAARELNMDSVEFRMMNAIVAGDTSVGKQVLNSVGFKECLTKTADAIDWEKKEKNGVYRGKGIACINHISGLLTVSSVVKINEDGTVSIQCGAMEIGQGSDTIICQIVAEELGVTLDDVHLCSGDTDANPYTWATTANRLTYTAGNSVRLAARDAKRQLLEKAAHTLKVDDLIIKDKRIYSKCDSCKSLTYHDMGKISAWVKGGAIVGTSSFMVEEPVFDAKNFTGHPFGTPFTAYIFAAQAVEVEVDVGTGQIKVLNAVAAHDTGRAINPNGVEGQIEGGFVQALGMALSEAVNFDAKGRIINANFTDYKIPAAADVPPIKPIIVEALDETGPYGAKGIGEACIMGACPAIANAVYDAIGIRFTDLPMTPEKVLKAISEKRGT